MNNRRKLVMLLGAGALAAPLISFAQQQLAKVYRIGFLGATPASGAAIQTEAFRTGLRDLGYVEGKNLLIEWRFADGNVERLPGLAAGLVELKVDVIVTLAPPATGAAQKATTAIPIVMVGVGDPVGAGFVKSLARPGRNVTGPSNISADLVPKQLELLLGMVPRLSRVAVLVNPDNPGSGAYLKNANAAAKKAGVTILSFNARTPQEIETAFSRLTREKAGAVILARDPLFNQQARQIADLAGKHRLPAIAGPREYVDAGGLMSYGMSLTDSYLLAAKYVEKILKGAKPADLPVELPTKFDLFINRKTAKALGLTIPQSLLISADKVIE